MPNTENNIVSTTDVQKIITLGGLETFYNKLQETHFEDINAELDNLDSRISANTDAIGDDNNSIIKDIKAIQDSNVIVKGDAENSVVLKGEYQGYSNKAISQTSMAVGAGTTAGLKGWYYRDYEGSIITILTTQPTLQNGILVGGTPI